MTSAEFANYKMILPGAQPFASGDNASVTAPGATTGSFSMPDGFGSAYDAAPADDGSNMVQRGQMNYIGKMASYAPFVGQVGGAEYCFDPAVATAIGGYHYGAILTWVKSDAYLKVISLKDNNMVDFTGSTDTDVYDGITNGSVDGINWQYLSLDPQTVLDQTVVVEVPAMNVPISNAGVLGCFKAKYSGALIVTGGAEMEDITPTTSSAADQLSTSSIVDDASYFEFSLIVSPGKDSLADLDGWEPYNGSTYHGTVIYSAGNLAYSELMAVTEGKWYGIGFMATSCKISSSTLKVKLVNGEVG